MGENQSKRAQGKNRTDRLGEKLEGRLASYVLTAGATGVAALALAPAAQAGIIYTSTNIPIVFNNFTLTPIDVNGDGISDMSFAASVFNSGRIMAWSLVASARPGNGVIVGPLNKGYSIGTGDNFKSRGLMAFNFSSASSGGGHRAYGGPWFTLKTEKDYLGLEFLIDGQTHFGWVGFTMGYESGTVTGYAYEAVSGESIQAGYTASPEPGTLLLLALGVIGLAFWRRKKPSASFQ